LFAANGESIRFRTRKHLALLVYLAVENRSHRREPLAELLWPKVSATEARHSLATALSVLRPRVGLDGLETSRDHVRLMPGWVALDLDRLRAGDVLGSEVIEPLPVTAFLDGFDIVDSAEFTLWKDQQQARLLPIIKDALLVLIDRCRRTGDTRQIEQLADRMLALDELCEDAVRAKMEARAFAGDRLTALEIFEDWKKKLAEELQAVPSDLVEGMAVRLRRRGWERTTLASIPNVPTDQWRGRPFIGRAAEYRALYELWEEARSSGTGHALILGDSGMGKTTLVQRLTTAAGLEGAAISRVQCYDLEREIPYSTLSSLLTGLLNRPGVSATSPEALAELSRTVPRIRNRFPNLPASSESQGETARLRLTDAFHEMLSALAEEQPMVLVVDDLHLADDVSLAVLHLILRRVRGQRVMVVLVARPGELQQSPQAARLRESSAALGMQEILVLPLGEHESREMLCSLLEPDSPVPSVSEQRALLRAAAGNPMAIELLVQDWKRCGRDSLALSVGAMTPDFSAEGPAQISYQRILERMTHSLDTTTQNVLNLASLLGQRLNDLSFYALMDISAGQTMSSMTELVKRRVLRDGAQGLEFVNELVRSAAYLGVPQSVRRVLHGGIADRFIDKHKSGAEDLGLEIAWHCMRAGRVPEATDFLLAGARESLFHGAVHSAERALSSAILHLRGDEHEAAVLLLAEVLQEEGRWAESLQLLRSTQITESQGRELATILSLNAEHWSGCQTSQEVLDSIGILRHIIETSTTIKSQIMAASVVSQIMTWVRDVEVANRSLTTVNLIPTSALAVDDLASLAASKSRLLYAAMERGACLTEIVTIATKLNAKKYVNSHVATLRNGLGVIRCCEGRYLDAKADFQAAYEINASLGNDIARASRACQAALCCFRLGQYREAIDWCDKAASAFGPQFVGYPECQAAYYRGSSHALLGEKDKALRIVDNLDVRIPATVAPWIRQIWLLSKADVLLLTGRRTEALAVGREAVGDSLIMHSKFFAGQFARWLALTSLILNDHAAAHEKLAAMVQDLDSFDFIDQVEVLCAMELVSSHPFAVSERCEMIQRKLAALPSSIAELLRLLAMLDNFSTVN
jgi:DNA-binding SARP family transcriptional activator/tetratricopeptide (TPR) repeat protein/type II secretory pathway predicted ATPase ExeA